MNVAELGDQTKDRRADAIDASKARGGVPASRLPGLDMLKGLLLLFVIVGHYPNVPLTENYFKQVIYAFHMPVFIIVTGFLFNAEKWSAAPFTHFVRHYLTRLLVPWAIASAAYYSLQLAEGASVRSIVKAAIFQPWSLLWFVPAVVLMMTAAVILARRNVRPTTTLVVSTLLVLGLQIWFLRYGRKLGDDIQSLVVLGDWRYYLYFPFFAFGWFLRRQGTEIFTPAAAAVTIVMAGLVDLSGRVFDDPAAFLFLNFAIGAAAIALARRVKPGQSIGALAFLGRESLPIYLWHYLVIVIARHFTSGLTFVAVASLGITAVIVAAYLLSRQSNSWAVNMMVFGR